MNQKDKNINDFIFKKTFIIDNKSIKLKNHIFKNKI